jgi:NO-binding membrane sensor protein with MHYT domain
MTSQDPHTLTPAAHDTALLVARVIFFNGLLIGLGFCAAVVGVLFFNVGNLAEPIERWLVVAVLGGLAIMAFGFTAMAKTRIAKLKNSAPRP